MNKVYLGIDVGGTAVKAGLLSEEGEPLARAALPTPTPTTPTAVVESVAQLASLLTRERGGLETIEAVGLGIPGRVDCAAGVIGGCANLGNWSDVPLADLIADALDRPAVLENDANAAALAEYRRASVEDRRVRHAVLLTLGTGIGAGLVLDGRLYRGGNMAGEVGHMIVELRGRPCPCGQRGCLEQYASASAIAQRMTEAFVRRGENVAVDAHRVFELDHAGDCDARAVLDEAAAYLGLAIVNLDRLLDLDAVILGGGLLGAGESWLARVRAAVSDADWRILPPEMRIRPARLGNDAGWIGAAHSAANASRKPRIVGAEVTA